MLGLISGKAQNCNYYICMLHQFTWCMGYSCSIKVYQCGINEMVTIHSYVLITVHVPDLGIGEQSDPLESL